MLLPGDMRQVGQANEHRPGAQLAKGRRTQDVGEQAAEQIAYAPEGSGSHKGSTCAGALLVVGWQLGEHFLLPSVPDHGWQLPTERWQRIIDWLGHRFLLIGK